VTDLLDRLRSALAERYVIERELGAGGMACRAVRPFETRRCATLLRTRRMGGQAVSYYG
jgi:hypothetical protein